MIAVMQVMGNDGCLVEKAVKYADVNGDRKVNYAKFADGGNKQKND